MRLFTASSAKRSIYPASKAVRLAGHSHTVPMVCWGTPKDHLVLSPTAAIVLAEQLIRSAHEGLTGTGEPDPEST